MVDRGIERKVMESILRELDRLIELYKNGNDQEKAVCVILDVTRGSLLDGSDYEFAEYAARYAQSKLAVLN